MTLFGVNWKTPAGIVVLAVVALLVYWLANNPEVGEFLHTPAKDMTIVDIIWTGLIISFFIN